jgi:hypothetical protein
MSTPLTPPPRPRALSISKTVFYKTVCSMAYRLLPETIFREQLEDVRDIEPWLRNKLQDADGRKIVVAGTSAGALLAMLTVRPLLSNFLVNSITRFHSVVLEAEADSPVSSPNSGVAPRPPFSHSPPSTSQHAHLPCSLPPSIPPTRRRSSLSPPPQRIIPKPAT